MSITISRSLDRSLVFLGVLDQLDNSLQYGMLSYLVGSYQQAAGLVESAGEDRSTSPFFSGYGFACDRALVNERVTVQDGAVDRNPLPGVHDNFIVLMDRGQLHVFLAAFPNHVSGFRKAGEKPV